MTASRSRPTFEWIPATWFEPVIGLWTVVLAGFGMQMTVHFGIEILEQMRAAPWAGIAITVFVAAVAYGGFGIGLTYAYRNVRAHESWTSSHTWDPEAVRWVAGLGGLALVLSTTWAVLGASVSLLGYGPPGYPDGVTALALDFASVNEMVNQAPIVLFGVLIVGVLMGPATGAVFHGILQETIADVASLRITLAGTTLATTIILGHADGSIIGILATGGFVLATAYAYRETETLRVPMLSYGLFNAITLVVAWIDILVSLAAAGYLFG